MGASKAYYIKVLCASEIFFIQHVVWAFRNFKLFLCLINQTVFQIEHVHLRMQFINGSFLKAFTSTKYFCLIHGDKIVVKKYWMPKLMDKASSWTYWLLNICVGKSNQNRTRCQQKYAQKYIRGVEKRNAQINSHLRQLLVCTSRGFT